MVDAVSGEAWVSILRCSDGSYYVGMTRCDIEARVWEHNEGVFPGYTSRRRPVTLLWAELFPRIDEAISFEAQLKGWSRAKKEALMRSEFDALPGLSRRGPARS